MAIRPLARFAAEALVVLLALLGLSLWIRFTDLDMALQRMFFTQGRGWPIGKLPPLRLFYHLGPVLPAALAVLALFGLCMGFRGGFWRLRRRSALFLLLHFLLGPGLLVNALLKEGMGRPRPRHVLEFGGPKRFVPVLEAGAEGRGASFPSGHASIGAFLLAPFFLQRRRSRKTAFSFLAGGLIYGGALGLTRMLQGGHFLSDVLWALGLVYLTGLLLARALGLDRPAWDSDQVRIDPKIANPADPKSTGPIHAAATGLSILFPPRFRSV